MVVAQAGIASTVAQWGIIIIIICAVIGIVWVFCRVAGVSPPQWLIQIGWIILAACVAIMAILFLLRIAGGG